ncbi:hypothetical protein SAMD00019534_084110 [Acytostelium subglobosum LB1]|uniref:hypothetical protein n=1 Tax=Acytostelium subglobosum LB1 TaxID=1410327 RepID=UPI0006450EB3|nr:hypothetical protein SAMD00019534_084110 [Acytostelium subglobosum LB1]GAM25236.1 hypothetical protein SAMD00019534_084110 [Acytostelium subglobosum LB1]|eukprot:XP_012751756.1 hypothetical protein SAMD00019534_084110 [Acytostelium subglobosum LB1]
MEPSRELQLEWLRVSGLDLNLLKPIYHRLKYAYCLQLVTNYGNPYIETKNKLPYQVDKEQHALFKQFKQQSFTWSYVAKKKPIPCWEPVWSGVELPKLILQHIIELLLFDNNTNSKWKVALSTVSTQFHGICTSLLSHIPIPQMEILSKIRNIGSPFCLFKHPPLHISTDKIRFIPKKDMAQCLDRLESLNVVLWSYLLPLSILLPIVHAKHLKHISFMDETVQGGPPLSGFRLQEQFTSSIKQIPPVSLSNQEYIKLLYENYISPNAATLQSVSIKCQFPFNLLETLNSNNLQHVDYSFLAILARGRELLYEELALTPQQSFDHITSIDISKCRYWDQLDKINKVFRMKILMLMT